MRFFGGRRVGKYGLGLSLSGGEILSYIKSGFNFILIALILFLFLLKALFGVASTSLGLLVDHYVMSIFSLVILPIVVFKLAKAGRDWL